MFQDLSVLESQLKTTIGNYKEQLSIDCILPEEFKRLTRRIESNTITYTKFGFKVSSNLDIYFSNQLWYLSAICVPLYDELINYGNTVKDLISKDIITSCKGDKKKAEEAVESINISNDDKELLVRFLYDYVWWKGGKTIDRGDYFHSPILAICNLVNASQDYVADMCKYLSTHKEAQKSLIDTLDRLPIPKSDYKVVFESTKATEFLSGCTRKLLDYDGDLSLITPHLKFNNVTIGFNGFQIGKKKDAQDLVTDPRRADDCDKSICWKVKDELYYLWKEQTSGTISTFANEINDIYFPHFKINIENGKYSLLQKTEDQTDNVVIPLTFENKIRQNNISLPLQQIYYGAPGTGKSHEIKEQTEGEDVIRTTFHPDSDYSTFVGAYKPTSKEITLRDDRGFPVKENGVPVMENRIIYEFVEQAFLQAYTKAWKAYSECAADGEVKKEYLVIEEINRGNCAQIFGDLFQLLDRNDWGFSEYPIKADNDMKKQLKKAFAGLQIAKADEINAYYKGKDVIKDVLEGECLLLPNNLYIWATMNTSDQSLFPIDSAFKRRWDWRYMPIDTAKENWVISVNGAKYSWTEFLNTINGIVHEKTQSEDKQLGFYFCKAKDGIIDAETFVGKVLFYLWNDVFKDYGFDDDFFKDEDLPDGTFKPLTFKSFYDVKTRKVIESQAEKFLKNLDLKPTEESDDNVFSEENKDEQYLKGIPEKQVKFWTAFNAYRTNNTEFSNLYSERKPLGQSWMDLSFGTSAYWPNLSVMFRKSLIRSGIWIGNTARKDSVYNAFKTNEAAINSMFDEPVIWDTNKPNAISISVEHSIDINDESKWPEAFEWLMNMSCRMYEIKKNYGV